MKPSLFIVDEFLDDPVKTREHVLAGEFESVVFHGSPYHHVNRTTVPDIADKLSRVFGVSVKPKVQAVRLDLEGEFPHNHAHADDFELGCEWASVLYLNPTEQCHGGTAFWRHVETGSDRMTNNPDLDGSIWKDWSHKEAWEMCGFAGMQFNRAVIYPTTCFHSRFPHEGFGKDAKDGRMVHVAFFNL